MSYDLAVWEGDRPSDDAEGLDTSVRLFETYLGGDVVPPTPRIRAYVEELLERWPDLGTGESDDDDDDLPWATGPLMEEASGPIVFFTMVFSMADEVSEFAARLADEHGLACFDPQLGTLRP